MENSILRTQEASLTSFLSKTYGWMAIGLLMTAAVGSFTSSSEEMVRFLILNRPVFIGLLILEFVTVIALNSLAPRISAIQATLGFLLYSVLNGLTFSVIFLAYTMESISQVFFITAGMFAGLAAYGTLTKRDLTSVGSFCIMGVWGLILASVVNLFLRSDALSFALSLVAVVAFTGLTAYDAQKLKAIARQNTHDSDKTAIFGALMLYLDFLNLFLALLRLMGRRR